MKFSKTAKVEKVTSTDLSQYAINVVRLEQGDDSPVLVATDGHALAVVKAEADPSEFGPVTVDAIKHGRKVARSVKLSETEFKVNGRYEFPDGSTLETPHPSHFGEFPNWRKVIPDYTQRPVTLKLGLNPKLFLALAEAIDSPNGVVLEFIDNMSPIKVTPNSDDGAGNFGVIMPMCV